MRPRVLEAALTGQIVAISAPEGSGVSTAAAQIGLDARGRMAWCRLTPGFDHFGDVVDMVATTLGIDVAPPRIVLGAADQLLEMSNPVR